MSGRTITKLGCALYVLLLIFALLTDIPQLALLPFYALAPVSDASSSIWGWFLISVNGVILASLAIAGFVSKRKAVAIAFVVLLLVSTLVGFIRLMIVVGQAGL